MSISAMVTANDVARAGVWRVEVDGDRRGPKQRDRRRPARCRRCPKCSVPQAVRSTPGSVITPGIRLTPAMRAAKSLRGAVSTLRTGPLSTTRPPSTTTTLSAIASASSRSWVTMIAVRPSVAQDVAQQPAQRRGGGDVECRHRFVEQQHPRFGGQRAGDGDALRLSAGELGGPPVGEIRCADGLEPALRGGAGRPTGTGPCSAGRRRRWRRRSCAGTAAPAGTAWRHRARARARKPLCWCR